MNLIKKIKQRIVDEAMLEMLKNYQSGHWVQILTDENLEDWKVEFKKIIYEGDYPNPPKLFWKGIPEIDCSNKLKDIKCQIENTMTKP